MTVQCGAKETTEDDAQFYRIKFTIIVQEGIQITWSIIIVTIYIYSMHSQILEQGILCGLEKSVALTAIALPSASALLFLIVIIPLAA